MIGQRTVRRVHGGVWGCGAGLTPGLQILRKAILSTLERFSLYSAIMHTKTTLTLIGIAGSLALGGIGCGPSETDEARTWATSSSAPSVYWNVFELVAVAQGERTFADPACPVIDDDGTVLTVTGECTTAGGDRVFGGATVTRGATAGDLELTLAGWGGDTDLGDVRTTGTATITRREAELHDFELDLVVDGVNTTRIDYEGTVRGTYDEPTTWNGTGTIEREGFAPTGRVLATTLDERFDGAVCNGQPISGSTTVMRDGRTDVVTYDGATDCDDAKAAQWSVNGASRGLLTDISCSARPGGGSPISIAAFGLVGLAMLVRRRRERDVHQHR